MKFGVIDASGTRFLCGITDEYGNTIEKAVFLTKTPKTTIPQVINFFKNKNIDTLAIGCFGPIDLNHNSETYGYIKSSPKIDWENFNILGAFKDELNIPILIDTHTNMAALGENISGAGKGLSNILYLRIGTGIGGGIIVNNKILHGMMHSELGHVFISRHPRDKFAGTCPFHGGNCIEGMASISSIERRWNKSLIFLDETHPAWDLESFYIAHAIVNYILVLAPEKIILSGIVMKYGDLFPKIRKGVKQLLNGYIKTHEIENMDEYIVPADLGDQSGYFGAIEICKRNFKNK